MTGHFGTKDMPTIVYILEVASIAAESQNIFVFHASRWYRRYDGLSSEQTKKVHDERVWVSLARIMSLMRLINLIQINER